MSTPQDLGAQTPDDLDRQAQPVDAEEPPRLAFPVVGIGASAGGLEAVSEFLDAHAGRRGDGVCARAAPAARPPQHDGRDPGQADGDAGAGSDRWHGGRGQSCLRDSPGACADHRQRAAAPGAAAGRAARRQSPGRRLLQEPGRGAARTGHRDHHERDGVQRLGRGAGDQGGRRAVHRAGPRERAVLVDAAAHDRQRQRRPHPAADGNARGAAGLCRPPLRARRARS